METFFDYLLEFFFIVAGVQFSYAGYRSLKDKTNNKSIGTAIFWFILGILFIFGRWISPIISGLLVVSLGLITLFNQFGGSTEYEEDAEIAAESARKNRNAVFIPVIVMAVSAIAIAMLIFDSSASVIVIGFFVALLFVFFIFILAINVLFLDYNQL